MWKWCRSPRAVLVLALGGILGTFTGWTSRIDARPAGPEPSGVVRATMRGPALPDTWTDEPTARQLGPLLLRDAETADAIRRTARRRLPPGRGDSLWLRLEKSRYRLDVLDGEYLLKVLPVALGPAAGPKEQVGDLRTPEGLYRLIPHHASPAFGPSFYILYPGLHDIERAVAARHLLPSAAEALRRSVAALQIPAWDTPLGGLLLLHGSKDRSRRDLTLTPWTQGCVALENQDLGELLDAFRPEDRPVLEILP